MGVGAKLFLAEDKKEGIALLYNPQAMLARYYRITDQKDFIEVKDQGELIQSLSFGLSYLKRKDDKPSRFAFVISNKVSKQSVVRNKVKRALLEAVRQSLAYIKPGYNVIFLAKEASARKYTNELMHEVVLALRAGRIMQ